MTKLDSEHGLLLPGLDGGNPLGFLAALGVLSVISTDQSYSKTALSWRELGGQWHPLIHNDAKSVGIVESVSNCFGRKKAELKKQKHLQLGKNLSIDPKTFRRAELDAIREATMSFRNLPDTLASFGSDAVIHDKLPRIRATELHFIFGSGHQNYLETETKLLSIFSEEHIREAIYGPWLNQNERLSFRWDPRDAKEHAYQWTEPGGETTTTTWGANLLAFEGVSSLIASVPTKNNTLPTTGFSRHAGKTSFVWPIWRFPLAIDTVRSVLTMQFSQGDQERCDGLKRVGVECVYSSTKIKIGDGANYKWAFTPAERIA